MTRRPPRVQRSRKAARELRTPKSRVGLRGSSISPVPPLSLSLSGASRTVFSWNVVPRFPRVAGIIDENRVCLSTYGTRRKGRREKGHSLTRGCANRNDSIGDACVLAETTIFRFSRSSSSLLPFFLPFHLVGHPSAVLWSYQSLHVVPAVIPASYVSVWNLLLERLDPFRRHFVTNLWIKAVVFLFVWRDVSNGGWRSGCGSMMFQCLEW